MANGPERLVARQSWSPDRVFAAPERRAGKNEDRGALAVARSNQDPLAIGIEPDDIFSGVEDLAIANESSLALGRPLDPIPRPAALNSIDGIGLGDGKP